MKVLDGVDLIITEGEKENTISYKNNGAIYIDGVKEQGVENGYSSYIIVPYAVASSYYDRFEDVP